MFVSVSYDGGEEEGGVTHLLFHSPHTYGKVTDVTDDDVCVCVCTVCCAHKVIRHTYKYYEAEEGKMATSLQHRGQQHPPAAAFEPVTLDEKSQVYTSFTNFGF